MKWLYMICRILRMRGELTKTVIILVPDEPWEDVDIVEL